MILIGRSKQWALDSLDKKDTTGPWEQFGLPFGNWPLTTHVTITFDTQCTIWTFNVFMAVLPDIFKISEASWLKRKNLSSKLMWLWLSQD